MGFIIHFLFNAFSFSPKKKSFLKAKNGNNLIDVNSYRFAYDKAKGLSKGSNFGKWLGNILIVKLPFCLWNFIESKKNSIYFWEYQLFSFWFWNFKFFNIMEKSNAIDLFFFFFFNISVHVFIRLTWYCKFTFNYRHTLSYHVYNLLYYV